MNSFLKSVWKRRWCRVALWVTLIQSLAMVHPFVRQSFFGPTIDGMPWWVYENEIRQAARLRPQPESESWIHETLRKIGFARQRGGMNPLTQSALPVLIDMADDADVMVRRFVLQSLRQLMQDGNPEIVATFRRHLKDDDPACRLLAARGLWSATADRAVKDVVLASLDLTDPHLRVEAVFLLRELAKDVPELFDRLVRLTDHPDPNLRWPAILALAHFGKRGIPALRKSVADPKVSWAALVVCEQLGRDATDLVPDLVRLRRDPDPQKRTQVENALSKIDPERFSQPPPPRPVVGPGATPPVFGKRVAPAATGQTPN